MKIGCKVENCLLETAERLARYLTLFSIIGVRLMHVAYLARVQPDMPATEVFSKEEIEAVHVQVHKKLPPAEPPELARSGAHDRPHRRSPGRKCDGEPGMTVLWRGWMRLYEDVLVIRAHKQALGLTRFELNDALLRHAPLRFLGHRTHSRIDRAASRRSIALGSRAQVCERLNWRRADGGSRT